MTLNLPIIVQESGGLHRMDSVLGGHGTWALEMSPIPPLSCPKVQFTVMT